MPIDRDAHGAAAVGRWTAACRDLSRRTVQPEISVADRFRTLDRLTAAAALTLGLVSAGRAQDSPTPARAAEPLPSAAEIVARYHAGMGAASFVNVRSLHSVGELAIPGVGITGALEVWQARPNKTQLTVSVPGFGEVRTGFTGESGWSIDPVDGPRVLEGLEAVQAADDANFDSHLRTAVLIDSMRTVERTTLGGHACLKVRTTWKSGRITHDCYSTETGLLVGSLRTHHASSGPADALILYDDYRQFGDVRVPTRITTQVNGVDQIITLHSVTLNDVPDSAFEPPAGIRTLLRR
jgi:hypothetical protein